MFYYVKRFLRELKDSAETVNRLNVKGFKKVLVFFDVIWCGYKYGAYAEDYLSLQFYGKPTQERKLYVTQGNKKLFYKYFYDDEARNILGHKNLFSKKFSQYIHRDWIYTEDVGEKEIRDFFAKHERVIVKPTDSTWGIGVGIKTTDDLNALLSDVSNGHHYMIEEILKNHPDVAKLNPDSLQTLRVETCLDSNGGFHLLNVLLMIGTKKTIVSNCHSGGVMCHVNMHTGDVDKAGFNPQGWWAEKHPQTGVSFIGFHVPYIEQLEEYIKGVCQVMPSARYVGWDVAMTPNGLELIEGNSCPGQCTQTCDGIPKYEILKSYL